MVKKDSTKKKPTKKKKTKKKTTKKKPPEEKAEDEQSPKTLEEHPGEEVPKVEQDLDLGSSLETGLQDELLQKNNEITLQNDQLRGANEHLNEQLKKVITAYRSLEDKVKNLEQQPINQSTEQPAPQPQDPTGPPQQPPAQQPAAPPESDGDRITRIEDILIQNNQALEGMIGILQRAGLYAPAGSPQVQVQPGEQVPIPLGGPQIPGQPGTLKDAAGRLAMKWLQPETKESKLLDALYNNAMRSLTGPAEDPFAEMGKEAFNIVIRKGLGGIGGRTAQDEYSSVYARERAKYDAKRISGKMLPDHED